MCELSEAFAILDYSVDVITQFDLLSRIAAEHIFVIFHRITLSNIHAACMSQKNNVFVTTPNVFFINKRKLSTGSAVADGVKAF